MARLSDPPPPVPTGLLYPGAETRPLAKKPPACSFRYPVCVHAGASVAPRTVLGALEDLESAASLLVDGVGLPRPLGDGVRGGGPAFDVYLVPEGQDQGGWVATRRDEPQVQRFDGASAFALVREDAAFGCVRKNLMARAFASASQWGLDAAEDPAVRESNAAYFAELVAPCATITMDLVDDFQAHPERGLLASSETVGGAVNMALPWYLDLTMGKGNGALPLALAHVGGQHSDPDFAWNNEPDLLDALRVTVKARTPPLSIDDLWIDFAVARLFMGGRDDGMHFPESAFLGSFGKVRFDWSLPYASLPRRVSPARPIDPTGTTYVWIDLRGAPAHARLAFRMEWEGPVLFRWALVRVKEDGSEDGRILVAPQQRSTSADKTLDDLDGATGVAVVGVNVGDLRLDDPFDPDEKPYEPHGYVLTVAVP